MRLGSTSLVPTANTRSPGRVPRGPAPLARRSLADHDSRPRWRTSFRHGVTASVAMEMQHLHRVPGVEISRHVEPWKANVAKDGLQGRRSGRSSTRTVAERLGQNAAPMARVRRARSSPNRPLRLMGRWDSCDLHRKDWRSTAVFRHFPKSSGQPAGHRH